LDHSSVPKTPWVEFIGDKRNVFNSYDCVKAADLLTQSLNPTDDKMWWLAFLLDIYSEKTAIISITRSRT
jgi:hypothetical protein